MTFSQPKPADLNLIITKSQSDFKKFITIEKFSKRTENKQAEATVSINALTVFAQTPEQPADSQEKVVEELRLKKRQEVDEAIKLRDEAIKELSQIRSILAEASASISQLEEEKSQLNTKIETTTRELKAKDMIAASFSGLDERQVQVQAAIAEVEELEREWLEAEDELQQGLAKARRMFEEKRSEVEMKQEKIEFYETNYSKLIQELKLESAKRERLIQEYKSMAKDLKREYLAQLIEDTKQRCKESETSTLNKLTELKSLTGAITKIEDEVKYLTNDIGTRIGEGEDKKKKGDKSYDKMRAAFDGLTKIFTQTKSYMEKFAELRAKNKQLQDRVMELKRAKYQEISEKLKRDLGELANIN